MQVYETKVEDLSAKRRNEYESTIKRLGKSDEWGKNALKINPVDTWEQWGFGSFKLAWVDNKVLNMMREKRALESVDNFDNYKNKIIELEQRVEELERRLNAYTK